MSNSQIQNSPRKRSASNEEVQLPYYDDPQELVNAVISSLIAPEEKTYVSINYANDKNSATEVQAYAKISGLNWTYYVKTLSISIGRNTNIDTTGPAKDGTLNDKLIDIDLGPAKVVSRQHAFITYNLNTRFWELKVIGRNGARVDGNRIPCGPKASSTSLHSGAIIDIGGTQMMFILPDSPPNISRKIIAQFSTRLPKPKQNKNVKSSNESNIKSAFNNISNNSYGSASMTSNNNSVGGLIPNQVNNLKGFQMFNKNSLNNNMENFTNNLNQEEDLSKDESRDIKPLYSYATMITQAILSNPNGILSLSEIYDWISSNYAYYRYSKSGWQNSIRHNLSLNKAFEKIPRRPNEPGKGMKWQISSSYKEDFLKKFHSGSLSKARRGSSVSRQLQLHLATHHQLPEGPSGKNFNQAQSDYIGGVPNITPMNNLNTYNHSNNFNNGSIPLSLPISIEQQQQPHQNLQYMNNSMLPPPQSQQMQQQQQQQQVQIKQIPQSQNVHQLQPQNIKQQLHQPQSIASSQSVPTSQPLPTSETNATSRNEEKEFSKTPPRFANQDIYRIPAAPTTSNPPPNGINDGLSTGEEDRKHDKSNNKKAPNDLGMGFTSPKRYPVTAIEAYTPERGKSKKELDTLPSVNLPSAESGNSQTSNSSVAISSHPVNGSVVPQNNQANHQHHHGNGNLQSSPALWNFVQFSTPNQQSPKKHNQENLEESPIIYKQQKQESNGNGNGHGATANINGYRDEGRADISKSNENSNRKSKIKEDFSSGESLSKVDVGTENKDDNEDDDEDEDENDNEENGRGEISGDDNTNDSDEEDKKNGEVDLKNVDLAKGFKD